MIGGRECVSSFKAKSWTLQQVAVPFSDGRPALSHTCYSAPSQTTVSHCVFIYSLIHAPQGNSNCDFCINSFFFFLPHLINDDLYLYISLPFLLSSESLFCSFFPHKLIHQALQKPSGRKKERKKQKEKTQNNILFIPAEIGYRFCTCPALQHYYLPVWILPVAEKSVNSSCVIENHQQMHKTSQRVVSPLGSTVEWLSSKLVKQVGSIKR